MVPKLFLTGATGYIGGDALHVIVEKHPDWHITCLVRNPDKGAKVAAIFPRVVLVYGDLDSSELIEQEAFKADVVYHFANCDHESSARAIASGLATREKPAFWIHTSGGMILATETIRTISYGEFSAVQYNDWEGVKELVTLPDDAAHRPVDKIVLAASSSAPTINTAIVCPPTIWGNGRGPDNKRSMQVQMATEIILKSGKGFQIGKGKNTWDEIHIHDLSNLYLLLGEAAIAGGPPATWNEQGYYLAENGDFVWARFASRLQTRRGSVV